MREVEYGSEEFLEMRDRDVVIAEYMGYERWTCSDYEFKRSVLFRPGANPSSWQKVSKEVPLAEGFQDVPRYHQDSSTSFDLMKKLWINLYFDSSKNSYVASNFENTNRVISEYAEEAVARLAYMLIIKQEIEMELNKVPYILSLNKDILLEAPLFMDEDTEIRVIEEAISMLLPEHFKITKQK